MMTPQEVANATFAKATIGGYNMAAVDQFLDKLTEDYTEVYKENAALKAKIKVLVDKIEEYHGMEDAMRSTLLTAQKMATSMVAEAEEKRASLLADAEGDAILRKKEIAAEIAAEEQRLEDVRAEINRRISEEEERLSLAQRELVAFLKAGMKLCEKQIAMIERIPALELCPDADKETAEAQTPPVEPAEVKLPDPVDLEDGFKTEAPVDDAAAAEAMAKVVEELGGDASTLVASMQNVLDSFSGEGASAGKQEVPFEIGFDDADKLFDDDDDDAGTVEAAGDGAAGGDDADDDHYDNFEGEDESATREVILKNLQFGRNYHKD